MMTAQFVQELPVLFSKSLNISPDDVIVMSITKSDTISSKGKKRGLSEDAGNNGIVVTMAVPETQVRPLQNLITDNKSSLYSTDNGDLPSYIDSSYPIKSQAGSVVIT